MAQTAPNPKRWQIVVFAVVGTASTFALVLFVLDAIGEVRSGHSLETYRTTWLVEFNHIGVLVFLAAALLALLVAGAFAIVWRRRERREWQDLSDRYGPGAKRDV